MFNKKATIGATMTWVVATIIILFIIIFFIYASYYIAKEKGVLGFEGFIQEKENSGIVSEQSLLAVLQTEIKGRMVIDYILQGEYSEVEEDVSLFLGEFDFEDSESIVYFKGKKIILREGSLIVE